MTITSEKRKSKWGRNNWINPFRHNWSNDCISSQMPELFCSLWGLSDFLCNDVIESEKDSHQLCLLIDSLINHTKDDTNQEHIIQNKMLEFLSAVCSTRGRACLLLSVQQMALQFSLLKLFVQEKSSEYFYIRTSEYNLLKIQRSIYNSDQKFMASTVMSVFGEPALKSIPVSSSVFM